MLDISDAITKSTIYGRQLGLMGAALECLDMVYDSVTHEGAGTCHGYEVETAINAVILLDNTIRDGIQRIQLEIEQGIMKELEK